MNTLFGVLLRKELRALVSDGRLVVLLLLWSLLSAVAAAVGAMREDRSAQEKAQVAALIRAQWDQQGDKHPHRGAHFGLYALRENTVLAAFDPGVSAAVGQALYLEPHRRNPSMFSGLADEPASAALVRMSPAFLMEVLLPLLVCVLAFASVTGERESGTLRMLHGVDLPRLSWLAAKVLAVAGCVTLAALPALLLPLLLGAGDISSALALRGLLILASVLLVALVYAAVVVSISCWCKDSRISLLIALALWASTALVLPRLGAAYAQQQLPSPDAASFWSAIASGVREGLPGEPSPGVQMKEFERLTLQRYGVTRAEDLPVGFLALRRLFRDAHADRVHDLHFTKLWDTYHRQQQLALIASGASPTLAWRAVSMAIAGTDLAHEQRFQADAEHYRREVNTLIDRWDAAHSRGLTSYEARYAGSDLWEAMPHFEHRSVGLAVALQAAAPALQILAGWGVAAIGLLLWSARKVSP